MCSSSSGGEISQAGERGDAQPASKCYKSNGDSHWATTDCGGGFGSSCTTSHSSVLPPASSSGSPPPPSPSPPPEYDNSYNSYDDDDGGGGGLLGGVSSGAVIFFLVVAVGLYCWCKHKSKSGAEGIGIPYADLISYTLSMPEIILQARLRAASLAH